MKGINGVQMNQDMRWHKQFKEMKKKCEIKNKRDISDKRFSVTIAKMFEQNIGNCRLILENAEVTSND